MDEKHGEHDSLVNGGTKHDTSSMPSRYVRVAKVFHRFCNTDLLFLTLLILYSIFGALIMLIFEGNEGKAIHHVPEAREGVIRHEFTTTLCESLAAYYDLNFTIESNGTEVNNCSDLVKDALHPYFLTEIKRQPWNFADSLMYVVTIHTTIGYGSLAPSSSGGRIFTVFYALLGIPLTLVVLSRLGFFFCSVIHKVWSILRNLVCGYVLVTEQALVEYAVEQHDFPISIALLLTLGWMLLCSGVFALFEAKWTYFTSFYFSFITLSTIGLGDVTPSTLESTLVTLLCIAVGLAMLSMCINLIQVKIERLHWAVMKKIEARYAKNQVEGRDCDIKEDAHTVIDKILHEQSDGRFMEQPYGLPDDPEISETEEDFSEDEKYDDLQ